MRTSCFFCFAEAENCPNNLVISTEDYWAYLQPQPRTTTWEVIPAPPLQTPPMCSVCSSKIGEIAKCHREIMELEQRLDALRKQLDTVVMDVREIMQSSRNKDRQQQDQQMCAEFGRCRTTSGVKRSYGEMTASSSSSSLEIVEGILKGILLRGNDSSAKDYSTSRNSQPSTSSTSKKDIDHGAVPKIEAEQSSSEEDEDGDSDFKLEELSEDSESEAEFGPFLNQEDLQDPLESTSTSINSPNQNEHSSSENNDSDESEVPSTRAARNAKRLREGIPRYKNTRRHCEICRKKVSLTSLSKHMKGHVGEFAFQCNKCSVTFPSRLSFSYFGRAHHKKTCKINPNFSCEVCREDVTYSKAFKHFEQHETSNKNYTCPFPSCKESFTWRQSLELHLGEHEENVKKYREKHPNTKTSFGFPDQDQGQGPSPSLTLASRKCEFCGESIPVSKSISYEHMISHVGEFAFQCPMKRCPVAFISRYSHHCLRNHRKGPHKEGTCNYEIPKTCEECNEDFDDFQKLRYHLKRHETLEKNFTCPITNCGEGFTLKQSVEFHLGSHAFQNKNKDMQICTVCPSSLKFKEKLMPEEMKIHLKDVHSIQAQELVKCEYCSFVFPNQDDLVDHLGSHVRNGGVKCHLCSSKELFRQGPHLRAHFYKEHQIGTQYLCESCDYSAFSLKVLKFHQQSAHREDTGRRKIKIFACETCEDKPTFNSADILKTHNITVHGEEKLKCNFCPETFISRQTRDNHEKHVHRGVAPQKFPCPEFGCDKVFNKRYSLVSHVETVHQGKSFSCSECEKTFQSQLSLKRHVQVDHEGMMCVCETCGKHFKDKKVLETHMRIHTGERPYLCKLCGLSFRQQSSLYNHNKAHKRKGDKFVPKGTFDRTPKNE